MTIDKDFIISNRKRLGLTQKALAKMLSIGLTTLINYENGKPIHKNKHAIIQETLGVEPKSLDFNFYNMDFETGFNPLSKPLGVIKHPNFNNVDFWILINGKTTALKEIDFKKFILFGQLYAIVTEDFNIVTKVFETDNKSSFLINENIILPKNIITNIYKIIGTI